MKSLKILFLLFAFISFSSLLNAQLPNFKVFFKQEYNNTTNQVFLDVYIRRTGSNPFYLGSANFVINFDENRLTYNSITSQNTNFHSNAKYLAMAATQVNILGDQHMNITVNNVTAGNTQGNEVTSNNMLLCRLVFDIQTGDCGTNYGFAWRTTAPGVGAINHWTGGTQTNVRLKGEFVNSHPNDDGFTLSTSTVCAGTAFNVQIPNSKNNYTYRAYEGSTYTSQVGSDVNGTGGSINIPVTFATAGTYQIRVLGFDNTGTIGDSSSYVVGCVQNITVNPNPNISSGSSSVCSGGTVTFNQTVGGLPAGGTWSVTPGTSGTDWTIISGDESGAQIQFLTSNSYTVTYTSAHIPGCVSNSVSITVDPAFNILSGPANNSSVCQDEIVTYEFDVSASGITFSCSQPTAIAGTNTSGNKLYIHIASTYTGGNIDFTFTSGSCTQSRTNITVNSSLKVDVKAFLGGIKDGSGGMNSNSGALEIALQDVYEDPGSNFIANPYSGILSSLPSDIQVPTSDICFDFVVDVIQIELRDQSNPSTIVGTEYAFLYENGEISAYEHGSGYATNGVGSCDQIGYVTFCGVPSGDYYIVVKHRNHLPIRSLNPVSLNSSVPSSPFDMTDPANLYGGTFNMFEVDATKAYMWLGNCFDDVSISDVGEVNASDFFFVSTENDNSPGPNIYLPEDMDLDGDVDADDFNMVQQGNNNLYFTDIPHPEL